MANHDHTTTFFALSRTAIRGHLRTRRTGQRIPNYDRRSTELRYPVCRQSVSGMPNYDIRPYRGTDYRISVFGIRSAQQAAQRLGDEQAAAEA